VHVSKYNIILDTPEEKKNVILNPLSGAVDIVDEEVIQFINRIKTGENIQTEEMNSELLEACLEKGYLFHDQTEETEKLKKAVERWYDIVRNLTERFVVYVTFGCNLKCVYCVQRETDQNRAYVISKEVTESMFRAIDTIHKERGKKENPSLTLFGGEPLMKRKSQVEAVEEILRNCSENDYKVAIVTNGVELSFYCDMLSKYNVKSLQVTLDGPKEVHDKRRIFANGKGTFDRIVKGIDDVLEKNIPVRIRVNIDEKNVDKLPRLARFITEKEWLDKGATVTLCGASEDIEECFNEPNSEIYQKVFNIYNAHPETGIMVLSLRISQVFQEILNRGMLPFPQAQFCWSTSKVLYSMDLYGNIFPCCCMNACCNLRELSYGRFHPKLRLNEDILEAWHCRNIFSLPQCRDCKVAPLCGGGCTRTALHYGKSLEDGVACPTAITEKEIQTVFNYYYPQLKERVGI